MRVLIVASVMSHIAQFHKPLIKMLNDNNVDIDIAAYDNLYLKDNLNIDGIKNKFNIKFTRKPLSKENIKAYKELKKIVDYNNYDVIHCNTPAVSVICRLLHPFNRKYRLIYTAHGFHFYKGASKKNWLFFYPIEKILSHFTDDIITINEEDYALAKSKFKSNIHHIYSVGIYSKKYDESKLKKYIVSDDYFKFLCVGELNDNKNQMMLLRAIDSLKGQINNVKFIFAGNGPNEKLYVDYIKEKNLTCVELLGYRSDLEKIVINADVMISVSKREGLGMNLLEGMILGKPCIGSNNRGHRELIKNDENGYLINDEDELKEVILKMIHSKKYEIMSKNSREIAYKYLDTEVYKQLNEIYFG